MGIDFLRPGPGWHRTPASRRQDLRLFQDGRGQSPGLLTSLESAPGRRGCGPVLPGFARPQAQNIHVDGRP
jgi:hypothetical protein